GRAPARQVDPQGPPRRTPRTPRCLRCQEPDEQGPDEKGPGKGPCQGCGERAGQGAEQAEGQALMHPNPQFRSEDRQLLETLIEQIGFGMVFLTTPHGPRVAHTPLKSTGTGQVRFHLARGNALSGHLEGATALVTVNGPDAYVS